MATKIITEYICNFLSFSLAHQPKKRPAKTGRFVLCHLLTFFTSLLSPVSSSKWYFVVTKSHYSNAFINIYAVVWWKLACVFCLHLCACCNYAIEWLTTECERCTERESRMVVLNDWHTPTVSWTLGQKFSSYLNTTNHQSICNIQSFLYSLPIKILASITIFL